MQLQLTTEIWKKKSWFVAKCPELDFVSQGATIEEAKKNLLEIVDIQLEEMAETGTLHEYLAECGYSIQNDIAVSLNKMIGFEKHAVQVG